MFHQYAHIKSLKSQPRESRREKEGKTNFCFISSSWRDHFILKLSAVPPPEPAAPSQQGSQEGVTVTDEVSRWPSLLRGGNLEGERPRNNFATPERSSTAGDVLCPQKSNQMLIGIRLMRVRSHF